MRCEDGLAYAEPGYWLAILDSSGTVGAFRCPTGFCTGGGASQSSCSSHRRQTPDNLLCGSCESGYMEIMGQCTGKLHPLLEHFGLYHC